LPGYNLDKKCTGAFRARAKKKAVKISTKAWVDFLAAINKM
jgi:hypothetical protein